MATLILRPNANGHYMDSLVKMVPDSGEEQWEDVDEEISDGDSTYIWNSGKTTYREGYFSLPSPNTSGTINKLAVYMCCAGETAPSQASLKIGIYTHSTAYWSNEITITDSYANYSQEWTTNPYTSSAWTWAEIENLEAGIAIRGISPDLYKRTKCTQIWVEIDYNPAKTSSDSGTSTESSSLVISSGDEGHTYDHLKSKVEAPSKGGGMKIWI